MTRQLCDLTFLVDGEFYEEITASVDLDDDEAAELTLATHLSRAIRSAGGDMSDLEGWAIDVRRHGYQAVAFTFQTDLWVEE